MTGLGAMLVLLSLPVELGGSEACPSTADVEVALTDMGATTEKITADGPPRYRAFLTHLGGKLHIDLMHREGARVAERELPASGSCADMARAVAVVVAAWMVELDSDEPFASLSGAVRPAAAPAPAPPAPPRAASVSTAPPAPAPPGVAFSLGIGLLASASSSIVPGAELVALARPEVRRWGLRASLWTTTSRTETLGPGRVVWNLVSLEAGPTLPLRLGTSRLVLDLSGVVALLSVAGEGFTTNSSDRSAAFGLATGAALTFPWRGGVPWLGLRVVGWPGHERLAVSGLGQSAELARIEVQVAAGVSLGSMP